MSDFTFTQNENIKFGWIYDEVTDFKRYCTAYLLIYRHVRSSRLIIPVVDDWPVILFQVGTRANDCGTEREAGSSPSALSQSRARPPSRRTCRGWTASRAWRPTCERDSLQFLPKHTHTLRERTLAWGAVRDDVIDDRDSSYERVETSNNISTGPETGSWKNMWRNV